MAAMMLSNFNNAVFTLDIAIISVAFMYPKVGHKLVGFFTLIFLCNDNYERQKLHILYVTC